jgi:hypothetical protein
MHHHPEDWFAMMLVLAGLAFAGMLIWGVVTSPRMGVPSVSMTQNDNLAIRACYVTEISIVGWCRFAADIYLFRKFDNWWVNALALVLGLLQILFLELVAIVTLDEDKNAHYGVASTAVMIGVARETVMMWRRACLPPRKRPFSWQQILRTTELFLNLVMYLLLIALIFAYGAISAENQYDFERLENNFIEYAIFFGTFCLIVFQQGDFNPTKCMD